MAFPYSQFKTEHINPYFFLNVFLFSVDASIIHMKLTPSLNFFWNIRNNVIGGRMLSRDNIITPISGLVFEFKLERKTGRVIFLFGI